MKERMEEGELLEGRYRIRHRIGEGGMGVVYAAEHVMLGRPCAVKVLHPTEAGDERMNKRFKAEAQSAANIRHPNVVEVMDFGITPDNLPFFVMEFLQGESLADRLDAKGQLAEGEAVEITDQILSGLKVAHKMGIVHRDLKPENIFLSKEGGEKTAVKILDFGISKIVGGRPSKGPGVPVGEDHRNLTQFGTILGTPGYMAPESIMGNDVDARADLFAVAVLLYEMLTGRQPFRGKSPMEILTATATKPVPEPTKLRPSLSRAMERLILTGLAKEPGARYQTADQFLSHLSAAAVGRVPTDAPAVKTRVGLPSLDPPRAEQPVTRQENTDYPENLATPQTAKELKLATISKMPAMRRAQVPDVRKAANDRRYLEASTRSRGQKATLLWNRISIFVSPSLLLVIAALGAAVYYLFIYQSPMVDMPNPGDPIDQLIESNAAQLAARGGDEAPSEAPPPPSPKKMVNIWVDAIPPNTRIVWNGRIILDRPLVVEQGTDPVQVELSAQGYKNETREVIPDDEKTLKIRLENAEEEKVEEEPPVKTSRKRRRRSSKRRAR